jgi:UDPglucose 6-dehydrogenase
MAGAAVRGYDPQAAETAALAAPWLDIRPSVEDAVKGADAILITTDWPEFAGIDWRRLLPTVRRPVVIDGRRLLDGPKMRGLGYRYEAVGTAELVDDPSSTRVA